MLRLRSGFRESGFTLREGGFMPHLLEALLEAAQS
jgi:hypothetical protein